MIQLQRLPIVLIVILLVSGTFAFGERVDYTGYSRVRVDVRSEAELQLLEQLSTTILNDYRGLMPLDAIIAPGRMQELRKSGLIFAVQNDDIGPATRRHLNRDASRGDWDDYMNFAEIVAFINALETAHPDLCAVSSIGTSIEGRDIWMLHITGAGSGSKPAVFYHSLIHCREWITAPVVLYLADHLASNYGTDPEITDLVDQLDIYLVPVVNPDGYVYTWGPNRLWRKNRRDNGDGTYGVDLNRNWGYEWGYDNYGSSPYTWDETYRGTGPFSEPETQTLRDFMIAHPDLLAYMDYHSYSQLILWPWGYDCLGGPDEPDGTTFDTLGSDMQSLIQAVHGKYYEPGPICETIYAANGGSVDWAYGDQGLMGFTIELRDTGEYGFELPPDQILPTCEENLPAILHLTEWAADQVGTSISFPSGLPQVLAPGTPEVIDVEIVSLGESLVPGSPMLHYRYDGGSFESVLLTHVGGDLYQATLPAADCTAVPEYYFSAEGTVEGVVTEPAGAPTEVFSTPVGELVAIFEDDFETDQGWASSGDADDGHWERGIPVDFDRGDPPADYDGSGRCYLTDNDALNENSDVDDGTTILTSVAIDMSDGATVSYAYWLNDVPNGLLSPEDLLTVEVATDAGGTNWTELRSYGTAAAVWRTDTIEVGTEVAASSTVRIRFSVGDLGSQNVVEAGIDAVVASVFECDYYYGDGDFDEDGDVDLADFAQFQACFGQDGTGECSPGNLAGDVSIGLADHAVFADKLTVGGPS